MSSDDGSILRCYKDPHGKPVHFCHLPDGKVRPCDLVMSDDDNSIVRHTKINKKYCTPNDLRRWSGMLLAAAELADAGGKTEFVIDISHNDEVLIRVESFWRRRE